MDDIEKVYGKWELGLRSLSGKDWEIRYCRDAEDRKRCASLRSHVFLGLQGEEWDEGYDGQCDHVVMVRRDDGEVMGCYRLLREDMLSEGGFFYGEGEFCMEGLRQNGEKKVELGRFCVGEAYRGGYVMDRLWHSLGLYLRYFELDLIFGCVSFEGGADGHEDVMRWLGKHYGYEGSVYPRGRGWFEGEGSEVVHGAGERSMWRKLPVLLRGYLMLGGRVGIGFYEDKEFDCTDMSVFVDVGAVPERYWKRLDRAVEEGEE